jgi:hypothetical protein
MGGDDSAPAWKTYGTLRSAWQCLEAAADMMSKGAPYSDPGVQRMVTQGRLKVAELPPETASRPINNNRNRK